VKLDRVLGKADGPFRRTCERPNLMASLRKLHSQI